MFATYIILVSYNLKIVHPSYIFLRSTCHRERNIIYWVCDYKGVDFNKTKQFIELNVN